MDAATLSKAMGNALPMSTYEKYAPAFNQALIAAQCTTVNRVAMFCAQTGTESLGLRYTEEIASGAEYEGRRDLGNIYPGDGRKFKGAGILQTTGRTNYGHFSQWAYDQGLTKSPSQFLDHPEQLRQLPWAFISASFYWVHERPKLNAMADAGDILGCTKAVNGGTNGLADRTARWKRIKPMGSVLLPEEDDMSQADIDKINAKLDALAKAVAAATDQAKQARISAAAAQKTLTAPLSYKIGSKVNSASPRSVWANTRIEAARATAAGNKATSSVKAAAAADATASQRIDKAVADVDAHLDEIDTEIHSAGVPDPEAAAVEEANK